MCTQVVILAALSLQGAICSCQFGTTNVSTSLLMLTALCNKGYYVCTRVATVAALSLRGAICRWYFGIEVSTSLLLQTVSIFVPSISSQRETIVFAARNAGSRFVDGIEYCTAALLM